MIITYNQIFSSYYKQHNVGYSKDCEIFRNLKKKKNFEAKIFDECFKSTKEKLCFKLKKEENLRKVVESFNTFLTTTDQEKKYAELIDKSEAKIMMHSHTPDDWVHIHRLTF